MSDDIVITAPAGSYARGDKGARVIGMLLDGASYRKIRAATGVATATIAKYKRSLADQGVAVDCECGEPSGHKGWCKFLVARSPARQATVAGLPRRGRRSLPF